MAIRYFAGTDDNMRNGSCFVKRETKGYAHYMNGDYLERVPFLPQLQYGEPLKEYTRSEARKLLPACMV